ncbi:hypothetical protein FRC08_001309 [Ceratobasidium sp. 394]|nr:hypothetical protein FRC08_001309 [Ceratobasidium sp. 394]
MQLLPLLSPGIHELDVRVHLPFIGPASNSGPHLQALLARSNVTYLILQSDIPLHIVTSLLSSVPHLRALALQHIRPRSQQTLEGLHLGMESDPDPPLPYLQCLCLILSNINSEVIGQLERVLAGRRLRCLVFWSCTFFNPEVNDNDEGDYTTWARDPAQSVRERLLEQVERLVIRPLPLARSHHRGVDLSMQALIAHE